MPSELKECPFCGSAPQHLSEPPFDGLSMVGCVTADCPIEGLVVPPEQWNERDVPMAAACVSAATPSGEPYAWQAMNGDGTPRIWDGAIVVRQNRDDAIMYCNTEGGYERPLYTASPRVREWAQDAEVRKVRDLFNQECHAADTVYDADVQDRLDALLAAVAACYQPEK